MKNIPASIHARLANEAQKAKKPFNELLQHYGMERPQLKGYAPEFVISEKLHAMGKYVEAPSRWKDYYDVWLISEYFEFNLFPLQEALMTTFNNRNTELPVSRPKCLSADFALKYQAGWQSFLKKNALKTNMDTLFTLTEEIWNFLETPLANTKVSPNTNWNPTKQKWE